MSKGIICCLAAIFVFASFVVVESDDSSGSSANDSATMFVKDVDGKTISKSSMSFSNATLDSDMHSGKLTYSLKCDMQVSRLPSLLEIDADKGYYQVNVSIIGLHNTPYVSQGVRMTLDDEFSCDLTLANSFKSTLVNTDGISNLAANQTYVVSLYSIETGVLIPPESLHDVFFTFSWFASSGTHIIMFVDENADFGLIIASEGDEITLLSPSGGKEFDCWMDQDKAIYQPGSTINVDSDMVMYAAWGETNIIPIALFAAIYLIILIVFLAVCEKVHNDRKQ